MCEKITTNNWTFHNIPAITYHSAVPRTLMLILTLFLDQNLHRKTRIGGFNLTVNKIETTINYVDYIC